MYTVDNNPNFYKDIDIIYEGGGYLNTPLNKVYHPFYRIIFFDNTTAYFTCEGNLHTIEPNQVIIIRPNIVYDLAFNNDIVFNPGNILYYDFNFLDKKSQYNCAALFLKEYIFDIEDSTFFKTCFEQVMKEERTSLRSKTLVISGIGLTLLGYIFRAIRNRDIRNMKEKKLTRPNIFLLSEIETKLNENFAYYSVVSNLCHAVGISENKLYKLIKKTYNVSPKEWITSMKISRIKLRLVERALPHDIADELGFSSLSYMGRFFKQHTKQTINEYLELFSNK